MMTVATIDIDHTNSTLETPLCTVTLKLIVTNRTRSVRSIRVVHISPSQFPSSVINFVSEKIGHFNVAIT